MKINLRSTFDKLMCAVWVILMIGAGFAGYELYLEIMKYWK